MDMEEMLCPPVKVDSQLLRKLMNATARALVDANPETAVSKFKEEMTPFWERGLAWVTEPPVRLLASEIFKSPTASQEAKDAATRLFEESEDAEAKALPLLMEFLDRTAPSKPKGLLSLFSRRDRRPLNDQRL